MGSNPVDPCAMRIWADRPPYRSGSSIELRAKLAELGEFWWVTMC